MDKQNRKWVIIYCILFITLVSVLTAILYPYFEQLSEPENQAAIQEWVERMGIAGLLIILAVQIMQVVIAFIPGEPVELLAGALYGTWSGLVLCLLGCIIGSIIIFSLSKRFGKRLLYRFFNKENVESWKWLQDGRKSEMVTFILFLIPGTPKDMLTYFVGVTDMSVVKFIAITTFARIPSVISSSLIGSNIRQGDWKTTVIVFIITGFIGIVGIGVKDRIIRFLRKD